MTTEGRAMSTTTVQTTFGKTIEADERELIDLERQGLIAKTKRRKGSTEAPAAADDSVEASASADTEGGAA